MSIAIRILAVLIALFGVGALITGIAGLSIVESSVSIMQQMRDAGSQTHDGIDMSSFRGVLYVVYGLTTLIGVFSLFSGIGIIFKKTWARLLWIGTLVLMIAWTAYSMVMSAFNVGFEAERFFGDLLLTLLYVGLIFFFNFKRTKEFFEVN